METDIALGRTGPKGTRLRLPTRTIRARLAIFYFGAFTLSGALLLIATVGYWQSTTGTHASAVPARGQGQILAGNGPVGVQYSSDSHQLLVAAAVALGLMVALSVVFGWVAAGRCSGR